MSTFATIISGVIVYIICQYFYTVWLLPLQKYKEIKSRIVFALSYYANIYTNTINLSNYKIDKDDSFKLKHDEASEEIRKLACELSGFIETLSWFKMGIPSKRNLKEASALLIRISNSVYASDSTRDENSSNHDDAKQIKALLKCYKNKKEQS